MKKFETGKQYEDLLGPRHIVYAIVQRTDKSVWARDANGKTKRFKIREWSGVEVFWPQGGSSLAVVQADRPIGTYNPERIRAASCN
jgi:hypothetical protein